MDPTNDEELKQNGKMLHWGSVLANAACAVAAGFAAGYVINDADGSTSNFEPRGSARAVLLVSTIVPGVLALVHLLVLAGVVGNPYRKVAVSLSSFASTLIAFLLIPMRFFGQQLCWDEHHGAFDSSVLAAVIFAFLSGFFSSFLDGVNVAQRNSPAGKINAQTLWELVVFVLAVATLVLTAVSLGFASSDGLRSVRADCPGNSTNLAEVPLNATRSADYSGDAKTHAQVDLSVAFFFLAVQAIVWTLSMSMAMTNGRSTWSMVYRTVVKFLHCAVYFPAHLIELTVCRFMEADTMFGALNSKRFDDPTAFSHQILSTLGCGASGMLISAATAVNVMEWEKSADEESHRNLAVAAASISLAAVSLHWLIFVTLKQMD